MTVRWEPRWESDLTTAEHDVLAELLGTVLGAIRAEDAQHFTGGRSWAGQRPEFRLLGYDEDGLVAHIGVLRRFLRVGETDQLVADLGLFAVRRDAQRRNLGSELLAELAKLLNELAVPFGFLGCRDELVPFYSRNGWQRLPGVTVRHGAPWEPREQLRFDEPLFVLPVMADLADWPAGDIDRNGMEV